MPAALVRHPLAASLKFAKQFGKFGFQAKPAPQTLFAKRATVGRYPSVLTTMPAGVSKRSRRMRDTFPGALDIVKEEPLYTGRPVGWGAPKLTPGQHRNWIRGRRAWQQEQAAGTAEIKLKFRNPYGERKGYWDLRVIDSKTLGPKSVAFTGFIEGGHTVGFGSMGNMASYGLALGTTAKERMKQVKRVFGQLKHYLPPKVKATEGQRITGAHSTMMGITETQFTRTPVPGRGLTMSGARESFAADYPARVVERKAAIKRMRAGTGEKPPATPAPSAEQEAEALAERIVSGMFTSRIPGTTYRVGSGPSVPAVADVLQGMASFPHNLTRRHYEAIARDLRNYLIERYATQWPGVPRALYMVEDIADELARGRVNFNRDRFIDFVRRGRGRI